MNFESWKWSPVATFESGSNKSALSFFDFQLFHVQKQVLTQIVTILGHFFHSNNFNSNSFQGHLKLLKYNIGIFAWYLAYLNPESHEILTKFRLIIHPSTVMPHYWNRGKKWPKIVTIWVKTWFWTWNSWKSKKLRALLLLPLSKVATGDHFQDSKFKIW